MLLQLELCYYSLVYAITACMILLPD
jgi:hypothetical protein